MIHLLTGGVRAGKSRLALERALEASPGAVVFVATGEARDGEMADRIRRHRAERGPRFRTVEAPRDPGAALDDADATGFVVDCLTLWVSNLVCDPTLDDDAVASARDRLVARLRREPRPVVVVTNEVGLGIIPMDPLTRRYQDHLGRLNQQVAAVADRVELVVAGLPLRLR